MDYAVRLSTNKNLWIIKDCDGYDGLVEFLESKGESTANIVSITKI